MMNRRVSLISAVQLTVVISLGTILPTAYSYATGPQPNDLGGYRSHITSSNSKSNQKAKATKYDLGLGKNPPVVNNNENGQTKSAFGGIEEDVYRVSRHWNEHQAVRSIPSPLDPERYDFHNNGGQHPHWSLSVKQSTITSSSSRTKAVPTIQYNRQSEDVLFIYEPSSKSSSHEHMQKKPTMVADTKGAQLDMNTPWVEMLLHSEQSKAEAKRKI